jgi:hypothetical protein
MTIKQYTRLLRNEFDYFGFTKKQNDDLIAAFEKVYQAHMDKGSNPEAFFSACGKPMDYAKTFQTQKPGIAKGFWSVIGLSLGVVFAISLNNIWIGIIFAGAFIAIDLIQKA